MKKILERWNRFLNEERKGNKIIGYHGTSSGADLAQLISLNKIKATLSRGIEAKAQGAGFYLFNDKEKAIQHAASHGGYDNVLGGAVPFEKEEHGYKVVITLEIPYNTKVLDIDYEVGMPSLYGWVSKYYEYLKKLIYKGKPVIADIAFDQGRAGDEIHIKWGETTPRSWQEMGLSRLTPTLRQNTGQPARTAMFFNSMEKGEFGKSGQGLAADFKGEMISNASAFKYKGPDISPTKVEIIDNKGNLHDVTSEVLSRDVAAIRKKVDQL